MFCTNYENYLTPDANGIVGWDEIELGGDGL